MNIQQLNNSGQSLQTFLVAAVVILLLTGILWLCTEQVNQYRNWLRRNRPRNFGQISTRPTYSIAVRVRMLVWLYCNGHWAWARETKAWRYIMANSGANNVLGFGGKLRDVLNKSDRDLSAGAYVSKYMVPPTWTGPFRTSSGAKKRQGETA